MSAFNLSLKKTTPSKVVFKPRLCDVLFLVRMEWLHFWETEAWLRLFSLTNNDFSLICLKYVYAYIFINVYIVIWMCVYKLCHVCFITQPTSVYFFSWPLLVFFFGFFLFCFLFFCINAPETLTYSASTSENIHTSALIGG